MSRESMLKEYTILDPSPVFAPKGYKILDADGNHICTLAKDIYRNEEVSLDQFTDWQITPPVPGDYIDLPIQVFLKYGPPHE